ncbi:MAG: hypothetical protein RLZZ488_1093 [Pseudomonadota bacterium]|jgi:phospholipid N-methyltransferase
MQPWKDIAHTIRHFVRSPHQIGTIIPSSRFLARKMIGCMNAQSATCIVELGAGTGSITSEVLRQAGPQTKVLIIDVNADAVRLLKERLSQSKNVEIIHADARHLEKILGERGIDGVEAIVSSLPFTSLSNEMTDEILSTAARVLRADGHFVAFQYTTVLGRKFADFFQIRSKKLEFRNIPPAIIYDCISKKKADVRGIARMSA